MGKTPKRPVEGTSFIATSNLSSVVNHRAGVVNNKYKELYWKLLNDTKKKFLNSTIL